MIKFATAGAEDPQVFNPTSKVKLFKIYAHATAQDLLGYDIVRHVDGHVPDQDRLDVKVRGEDGVERDLVLITYKGVDHEGNYSRNGYILTEKEVDKWQAHLNKRCWSREINGEMGVPLL